MSLMDMNEWWNYQPHDQSTCNSPHQARPDPEVMNTFHASLDNATFQTLQREVEGLDPGNLQVQRSQNDPNIFIVIQRQSSVARWIEQITRIFNAKDPQAYRLSR